MKKLILAFAILCSLGLQAQKKVEKQTDYDGQSLRIDLDLASSIEVKTWEKSSIKIEASIETEDPQDSERYELLLEQNGSEIKITSNSKDLFKQEWDDRLEVDNEDFDFDYIVYIPKDVQLELSSITGDLTSDYIQGDISIELVTGNIDIQKFQGVLDLRTVTGKISLPASDTSLEAKTVMGEIYASKDPDLVKKNDFIGQEISLSSGNTINRLNLSTVTGDIHLK